MDFYGDANEAAGHPANFSSILFLAERLWRGPVVARRLLRWLYQSQSSLKSITHTHQRLPCTAIVTEPSGPQHTVYIYLYELYVALCARLFVCYFCVLACKWVWVTIKVRVKIMKASCINPNYEQFWMQEGKAAHLSIHHAYCRLLYTCSQLFITCLSCAASSVELVFLCGGLSPLAPVWLVSWYPVCLLSAER